MVKWVRCPALGEKMATSLFNGYGTGTCGGWEPVTLSRPWTATRVGCGTLVRVQKSGFAQ